MKYKIISAESRKEMEEAVQLLLDDGWDLYGNLIQIIHPATHRLFYYREMVKYDHNDIWEYSVKVESAVAPETIHAN